ncbi:hypothetical protein [Streptomyces sp. NPDC056660]|uniref:hypothetical protein n=1 Tax=Streptomyces sp. NPDC056660 TaxID=3345897 RepID=UPI0036BA3273
MTPLIRVNSLRRALDPEGTRPAESVIRSGKGWYRLVVEAVRLDTADLDERGNEALHRRCRSTVRGPRVVPG